MQRENIFTGIKLLSDPNTHNNMSKNPGINQGSDELISIKENTVIVRNRQNFKIFKFDSCLDKNCSQKEIYEDFGLSMVEDLINGYDCTLIICGLNSKEHPITDMVLGGESQQTKGLIPRMIQQLRNSIGYFSERKFLIKTSFLQIHNEQMIDLLAVKRCKLELKQQKANQNQFYVKNLQIKPLQKVDDLESFYLIANRKRDYAYSKGHRKREKSTAFFTVYLESLGQNKNIYRRSKLNICELAQSVFEEFNHSRESKNLHVTLEHKSLYSNNAKRFHSANETNINLSNHAFLNVINTLVFGEQHITVPYKDSKITKLLMPALGGTHKTSVLGIIDPSNQTSLSKNLKILKTLQVAALIQNSPTNIKCIDKQRIRSSIVDLLSEVQNLSDALQRMKSSLHILQNNENYVAEEVEKIRQKNEYQLIKDNEFCSQKHLQDHVQEQKTKMQYEKKLLIKNIEKQLKQKITFIQNFSNQDNQTDGSEVNIAKQQIVVSKRKEILLRIKNIKEKRLNTISSLDTPSTNNQKKRELFALQIQFHKEKSLYLSTIRQLQEKLSLYKKLAENSFKPSEIEFIRRNSKYDESKREYDIPLFVGKERKMRTRNMVSRSISEKNFVISPRSFSFNSIYFNSDKAKYIRPLQIKTKTQNNPNSLRLKIIQSHHQPEIQYQVENQLSFDIQKKQTLFPDSSSISRIKSPSTPIANNKNQNFITRIFNDEQIKKVFSDYEIDEIDCVKSSNQPRKISKSKKRNQILIGVSHRNPNNLMKRQKLNTEPSNREQSKQIKQIWSPSRDYFPQSPRHQTKRWV